MASEVYWKKGDQPQRLPTDPLKITWEEVHISFRFPCPTCGRKTLFTKLKDEPGGITTFYCSKCREGFVTVGREVDKATYEKSRSKLRDLVEVK